MLNLQRCGVKCKIENDALHIFPSKNFDIKNKSIKTDYDHRIAMAFAVMGTKIGPLKIEDAPDLNQMEF